MVKKVIMFFTLVVISKNLITFVGTTTTADTNAKNAGSCD